MKPVVSALMMVMVVAAMTVADPIGNLHRVKRQQYSMTATNADSGSGSGGCEAQYAAMSPQHTLCIATDANAQEVVLSQEEKNHILQLHNSYRGQVNPTARNMRKLVWDDRLERTARQVVKRCIFDHDRNRDEPDWINVPVGQNIAAGHVSWDAAISRFFTEPSRANYTYGDKYLDKIGHYFQMVFAESARIGCAQANCPNITNFRACNFAIRLDVGQNDDTPPYKSGEPCADCPNHCNPTEKLCDCGNKLCFRTGVLNLTTCECKCPSSFSGPDCSIVCNGKTCQNGGTLNEFSCKCSCPSGFSGENCETDCNSIVCQNGGTPNPEACGCTCSGPYAGNVCQETCTSCSVKNSHPVSVNGKCACRCNDNWFKSDCSKSCLSTDQSFCQSVKSMFPCTAPVMQDNCAAACKAELCNNPIVG